MATLRHGLKLRRWRIAWLIILVVLLAEITVGIIFKYTAMGISASIGFVLSFLCMWRSVYLQCKYEAK